ncbi:MAG: SDR family oxidoreductase [Alphaproteobacteria bacterium]
MAARELAALSGDIAVHSLDVTDIDAIDRFAATLSGEAVDVLINNAGIMGRNQSLDAIDYEWWEKVMAVNTLAPLAVAARFFPHLERGKDKRIAFLTSRMGSIADNTSGGFYAYRASKAALNAAVKSLSTELEPKGIIALLLHPGWVRTDMGGPNALLDVGASVTGLRGVITGAKMSESGHFMAYDGTEIPW